MSTVKVGDAEFNALSIITKAMSDVNLDPMTEPIVKEYTLVKLANVYHHIIGAKYNGYQKDYAEKD